MQQSLLGWIVFGFGCLLMVRVLFMRKDSFGLAVGFLAVGLGATITGLWLLGIVNLSGAFHQIF